MTGRERIAACLEGKALERPPCTPILMAWAAELAGHSYREYQLDWKVLAKSQLLAAKTLGTDQVSAISDPWREAEAFGAVLEYPEHGVGIPQGHLLQDGPDPAKLRRVHPMEAARTRDRVEGVRALAEAAGGSLSVLGWVEGVFAEYVDLRGLEDALIDVMDDPEELEPAQEVILQFALEFAAAQVKAGATMVGVGEAAASLLSPALYQRVVLPWQKRLISGIHDMGAAVKLHICGNTTALIPLMAESGADVIDVDWMVDLAAAKRALGVGQVVAGNFDPSAQLRFATPEQTFVAAARCREEAGPDRFILQPGCEVPPGTPLDNVLAFCPGPGG